MASTRSSDLLKVFIVEDSAIIRERLAEALTATGRIEVVGFAETERDAVSALRDHAWDALVLDLQLKQGNGLGVLKVVGPSRPPGSKIIVLTNYAIPQYREKSMALGADGFFDKSREYDRVCDVLIEYAQSRGGESTH